jgi:ferredoxin-NADP reductase
MDGAWYPAGGPERIARYAEELIEAGGGRIVSQADAVSIPTSDNAARGVLVHHLDSDRHIFYEAKYVVSSIGAPETFRKLEGPAHESAGVRETETELAEQDRGYSCVILFLGLRSGPESFGSSGGNYWLHARDEQPSMAELSESVLAGTPRNAYLSFPGIKAGDGRPQTAEIIAFVDPRAFDEWRNSDWQERGSGYEALKERIGDGLIELAESRLPGFRSAIAYRELATPLSITHFTSRPSGRMYGLAATPARYSSRAAKTRTPVKGLYLSGADVVSVGIVGAMIGGLGPALQIAGAGKIFPTLYKPSKVPGADSGAPSESERRELEPLSGDRRRGVLLRRTSLENQVYELVLSAPAGERFIPGQFLRLEVAPEEWRDYSIASYQDGSTSDGTEARVTLAIDTQFGGAGGMFAKEAALGTEVSIRMPVGSFVFQDSPREAVFVATGTGITPFIPMFAAGEHARLFFGCRTKSHDLTERYVPEGIETYVCISRERVENGGSAEARNVFYREGHVTEALSEQIEAGAIAPRETDFYLCGNPDMVHEVRAMLFDRGAQHVYQESY